MAGPIHYELYLRKTPASSWTLMMATEDRANALETAEELLADKRAVAVRVTKETLDPDTMAFNSITLLNKVRPRLPGSGWWTTRPDPAVWRRLTSIRRMRAS